MGESPLDIDALGVDDLKGLVLRQISEIAAQKAEIAALREEIARLKGLKGVSLGTRPSTDPGRWPIPFKPVN